MWVVVLITFRSTDKLSVAPLPRRNSGTHCCWNRSLPMMSHLSRSYSSRVISKTGPALFCVAHLAGSVAFRLALQSRYGLAIRRRTTSFLYGCRVVAS
jgi:hypothetical protein